MPKQVDRIIYTYTDEAPALATYSLLPIIKAFAGPAGVTVETRDISLAGRILANFPENLSEEQRIRDALTELGEIAKTPAANIIKLPNISASIPQLKAAISELQDHGYDVPDYPGEPRTEAEAEVHARYARVLGSAVNPVLREGNSDRRVAAPVKAYAQKHPHRLREWDPESPAHVAHMDADDFYGSEKSHVMEQAGSVRVEFVPASGETTVLLPSIELLAGEVIDGSRMSCKALRAFFDREIEDAQSKGVLFSLHMKATMMKVSDPIIFGHAVEVFFKDVFEKHGDLFAEIGVDASNGLGDVYAKIADLPDEQRHAVEADIRASYADRPSLAMVDSDRGITNLHVPSDIIIDASMPVVVRDGGMMWGPDGTPAPAKAVIPDRCYAGIYKEIVEFCKEKGAFDVSTMGNVCNVGLMAQKAEEYGSHDKTFEIPEGGTVRVVDNASGDLIFEHTVEAGDIWRACQTKDAPIRDWVKLAVHRARDTGSVAIFWLDEARAHDANLIGKVNECLSEHNTDGLDIRILPPSEAMRVTCERAREGVDTISVTGNVLRDYLTDLFPILELGTSAKMLSIVPLLAGGGLFETGAGGSAPKHVQQFMAENHLRWDSLGEFLALAVSLEHLAYTSGNRKAGILGETLNAAIGKHLENRRAPGRKVHDLDNRGSHFYLAAYWAEALAAQTEDEGLKQAFGPMANELAAKEEEIVSELNSVQGHPMDIGGYYQPDCALASAAMRPSATLNDVIGA
jgi:isocitrate dehydrogenase